MKLTEDQLLDLVVPMIKSIPPNGERRAGREIIKLIQENAHA
jgi:hypothetical protein